MIHAIAATSVPVESMRHQVFVVRHEDKPAIAAEIAARPARTLFFVRTKHGADRLAMQLTRSGLNATAIHGNLNQNQRLRALDAFTSGRSRVLVATDVAARGLHVDDLDLVVHYDPPNDHKDYLHRSGRTARAGASGTVLSLVEPGQARDVARMQAVVSVHPEVVNVESGHRAVRELAESGEVIDIIAGPPATIPSRSPQAPRGPRGPRDRVLVAVGSQRPSGSARRHSAPSGRPRRSPAQRAHARLIKNCSSLIES